MNLSSHHLLAICLDSGDTLVDEGTEIKDLELLPLIEMLDNG